MNVTIQLSGQKAAALKAQAEAHGLTVERWLEQIAEQHVVAASVESSGNKSRRVDSAI
jgi:predicted DNA binding CopG/RHH family protein